MRSKILLKFIGIGAVSLFSMIVLSGCTPAASGPQFQTFKKPKNNKGMLYVYRPSTYYMSGYLFDTKVNNKSIGVLKSGWYVSKELSPGKKTITLYSNSFGANIKKEKIINIQKNRITCLKYTMSAGFTSDNLTLTKVSNKQCLEEIKKSDQNYASNASAFASAASIAGTGLIMSATPTSAPDMIHPNSSVFMKK